MVSYTQEGTTMSEIINHCVLCGKEIEPEEEYCEECITKTVEPCPDCGKAICECETGSGD